MTQDDMPAPAVVDEELAVIEVEAVEEATPLVEYVPPASPRPEPKLAKPAPPVKPSKPAAPHNSAGPDPFAVGVRVLKMAPAWLLFTAVCCSALVLLLGWVRSSGEAEAVTLPAKRNDARAAKPAPAAPETAAKTEAVAPVNPSGDTAAGPKTTAANDAPPAAVAQAETPAAPPAQAPQPQPPAAPKADEKPRVETPAQGAGEGKFTAQVGSFNSQSEANERVSTLRAAGFEAQVAAAELPGRGTWYRVQVGRFADRDGAAQTVAALRAKGAAAAALVVPVQK
ncbi:MAG: SPOR domain-containing protein [Acidobacteria bacterium]|nr:SPOR domain-containing protein [Acidobacteriota bacterium]